MPQKLDMSKAVPIPNPNQLNTSSAALSYATHINMGIATKKLDLSKAVPIVPPGQEDQNKESLYGKISKAEGNFSEGAVKGVASTLTGLGTLVSKGLSKIPGKIGKFFQGGVEEGQNLQNTVFKADGTAQEIGKGAEQIGEFFIPSGAIGDAEKALTSGTNIFEKLSPYIGETAARLVENAAKTGVKMGVRAGEGGGIIATQSGGDGKEVKTAAEIGGIIPPVAEISGPILSKISDIAGGAAKRFIGAITGRGTHVIDSILDDPQAALEGLKGKSVNILTDDAAKIKQGVSDLKTNAQQEYNRVLNNIQDDFENSSESFDKATETKKVGGILGGQGIELGPDGNLSFEKTRFDPKKDNVINKAFNMIRNYSGVFTPKSMDTLAARLESFKSATGTTPDTDGVIQSMINSLRSSVTDMAEKLGNSEGAGMSKRYAQAMDKIDYFKKGLSTTTTPFTTDVEAERARRSLSTLFTANKEGVRQAIVDLGLPDVVAREAGRTMSTSTERASGNIASKFWNAITDPIFSPKMIGKLTAWAGITSEKVPEFLQKLSSYSPAIQGAIIEQFSKEDDSN